MAENFVSVRIYHHRVKDMSYIAQENFRVRDPRYTVIEVPKIIAEMSGKRLEVVSRFEGETQDKVREAIRGIIYKSHTNQIARFQQVHKTKNGKGRKWQSNQNSFDHAVISFSSAGLVGVNPEELLRLGKVWAKRWAEENHVKNLYVCLHLDEKTPHLHLCFENITAEGVSFRRRVLKSTLSHCQDLAGEVFGELGFRRGISRELTGKEHEDKREYNRRVLVEQEEQIKENEMKLSGQTISIEEMEKIFAQKQAEVAELKQSISELRRTKQEQAEADRQEEAERVRKISEYRRQLKEVRIELKDTTEALEKRKAEIKIVEARLSELKAEQDKIKQIEGRKKFMIFKLLQALKRANVLSVGFAYRTYIKPGTKNEGNWFSYGKSNKDSKRGIKEDGSDFCWFSLDNSDVNQRLAEDILTQQKEFHCKIYGTPALWILDDVTPENLEQIKADFSAAPYFTIETSPGNFTVAIAAENKKDLKTIDFNKWRAVDDFLISRYNADKTGSAKHHYWRLPGCPRLNLDGYIPSITFGDKFSDTIIDNIYEQTRAQSDETTKATDKIREKIKLSKTGVEVPEWFIRKFVRFYNDINEDYPDVHFFRAMKDIIRSGRKNGNEIRYAEYCLRLLSVGALRDYGGRTKDPHKQEKIVVEALSEVIEEIEPEP